MSQKALKALAQVVWEEVQRNPEFAQRVENALGSFAIEFQKARDAERGARSISLLGLMKEGGADLLKARLSKLSLASLQLVVSLNNIDPSGAIGPRPKKADLVEAIVAGAERKVSRRGVFDY